MPTGGVRLPHGARELGALPASTPLRLTVALKPRDPAALSAYASAVSTPGSAEYHRYLSVAGFAHRFAPTAAERRLVTARLRADGLRVGASSPNGLSIMVRGSAGVTQTAFSTAIARYAVPGRGTVQVPARAPRLHGRAGALVQAVVGLDTIAPSGAVRMRGAARRPGGDLVADAVGHSSAGPVPCAAAKAEAASQGGFTPDQIAARYGLSNYYAAGDEGRGVTVALYELEPFSAADIASYQACMGTSTTVQTETVDGGAGSGSGSGEAATDVEDLIGLVPDATIRVYEGPPTGLGAYATYSAIVSDDAARVVSTSWGVCEAEQGALAAQAENSLFQEAAVQGQSVLAASGDSGADDCGNGTRAVDDPASQPFVTAVGGTSAHGATDTVWDNAFGAGGGGASSLWPRPAWQSAAAAQSAVSCGSAGTACREVPDISVDSDPTTGYTGVYRGAWRILGGTSVAAPTVAALAALADASPACASHPLGFLDPALYAHAADIADVTSGSNSFDGVLGYAAGPGYDMASGLGTPTAALGPALCGDSLSLATPAAQSWSTARAVAFAPSARSVTGAAITFTASGLPAGLVMNSSTGAITGTPSTAGRYSITLTAIDADGAGASATFAAVVTRPPAVATSSTHAVSSTHAARSTHLAVKQLRTIVASVGRTLRIRLHLHLRDVHGWRLRYQATGLPAGLRIGSRSGVVSGTPRHAGHATVTIRVRARGHTLATARVRLTIAARARSALRARR